jgi:hypothetical protein
MGHVDIQTEKKTLSYFTDFSEIAYILDIICFHSVTDLINALPGNSALNTAQHAAIDEAVFSMSSAPSSGGTTGLCNPFLSNGSANTSA